MGNLIATTTLLAVLALLGALAVLIHDVILWKRMPPGPQPLPFVGNKLDLPKQSPWLKFQEWSRVYGPIFTIWIGRRPTIVISDPNVAVELMEKRSQIYSSRPRAVVMGEIFWDMSSILVQVSVSHAIYSHCRPNPILALWQRLVRTPQSSSFSPALESARALQARRLRRGCPTGLPIPHHTF